MPMILLPPVNSEVKSSVLVRAVATESEHATVVPTSFEVVT